MFRENVVYANKLMNNRTIHNKIPPWQTDLAQWAALFSELGVVPKRLFPSIITLDLELVLGTDFTAFEADQPVDALYTVWLVCYNKHETVVVCSFIVFGK